MSGWEVVEKASGRWGVIEPTGPKTMRIIADDLSEEEARRVAASEDLLRLLRLWLYQEISGNRPRSLLKESKQVVETAGTEGRA